MISIEQLKLAIETLKEIDEVDWKTFKSQYLTRLEKLAKSVDAYNESQINRIAKTKKWFQLDLDQTDSINHQGEFDTLLFAQVKNKIGRFAKMGGKADYYNSLEIGPGYGTYSKCFLAWRLNFFLELLTTCRPRILKKFNKQHHKYLRFHTTDRTDCGTIPDKSVNFVFSWDVFPFLTQSHIEEYLKDMWRVILPGGYCFIHYADCLYEKDLLLAQRGYWNYNTKNAMKRMIKRAGYGIIEMDQFRPGANYAIFQKPGKLNPVVYRVR